MMEEAAKAALPEPAIEEYAGGIQVTFLKSSTETVGKSVGKSVEKGVEKSVEKSVEKIITLMDENPYITQKELSLAIGLSRRGIEKNISKLKKEGKIKRIGPAKGGHWEVIK